MNCTANQNGPRPVLGTIDSPGAMFLREAHGTAKNPSSGVIYELNCHLSGSPVVRSSKTGKWFTLSWNDILHLAHEAGIDDAQEAP